MALQEAGNPYISAGTVPLDENPFWETDGHVFLALRRPAPLFPPESPADWDEPLHWGQLNTVLLAVNNFRRAYPSLDFSWMMFSHVNYYRALFLGQGELKWNGTSNG